MNAITSICFNIFIIFSANLLTLTESSRNKTDGTCPAVVNSKCRDGVMLPAWIVPGNDDGAGFVAVRAFIYFIAMFILFIGISIISDRFMASIEVITSQEKEITVKDRITGNKHIVTVKIWNETVANLSLMALGSSAPEILLSVIEIIGRNFKAGELGPSTVVGSAAFNLFMITAVCVSVLPDGEVRRIKHLKVFAFTATCSIFAYVWMYIILAVFSPGIIRVWEGVVTFLCFPGMVGIAWMIDAQFNFYRFLRKKVRSTKKHGHHMIQTGDGDIVGISIRDANCKADKNHIDEEAFDNEELELLEYREGEDPESHMREKKRLAMEAYHKLKQKYPDADFETLKLLVDTENRKLQHKSRAYYRIQAVRNMTGQGTIFKKPDQATMQKVEEAQKEELSEEVPDDGVYFSPSDYTVVESCGTCYLTVVRYGPSLNEMVKVDFETYDGTANEGEDYESTKGTLVFSPGETEKLIGIKIIDDDVFELDEHFFCKLSNPRCENLPSVELGGMHTATITILDDDYPGVFTLENAEYVIMETVGVLTVRIIRLIGARGAVRIPYHTEEVTAKGGGEDYDDLAGEVEFPNEECVKTIEIMITDHEEYEKDKVFKIVLGEPVSIQDDDSPAQINPANANIDGTLQKILEAGKPALGENREAEVHIQECQEFRKAIDAMLGKHNMASFLRTSTWAEQFKDAFVVEAGDDGDEDEESEPTYYDYFMHYLSLIWKVMFAFVPPTDIWGGWACFWVSIGMIGVLTAVTGDIASHFGCTIGLADSVVAITFVALGTSLPDTFASKTATMQDEYADGSIGNVTGSNSVNVFLGIGLAWSCAAIYHEVNGNYFYVEPGSLGFSVLVFCVLALVTIGILMFRRFNPKIGAELGGPKLARTLTSTILSIIWVLYILLASLESYCHIEAF